MDLDPTDTVVHRSCFICLGTASSSADQSDLVLSLAGSSQLLSTGVASHITELVAVSELAFAASWYCHLLITTWPSALVSWRTSDSNSSRGSIDAADLLVRVHAKSR